MSSKAKPTAQQRKRQAWVFVGLLSVLTGTSALLLAVAPAPLKPDSAAAAWVSSQVAPAEEAAFPELPGVTDTRVAVAPNRWQYIYVRHSRTAPGAARTLGTNPGDHFVIGSDENPRGGVQMTLRWDHQVSAAAPQGVASIDPRCVTIVLVGDLDRTVPTPAQLARTTQLVRTLQKRLNIPSGNVLTLDQRGSSAGTGRYFPTEAFRENLLP